MTTRVPGEDLHGRFVYLMLVVLVLIWAANWSLVKTVFGYISPPSFVLWRFCGAPVVMAAIMLARRQPLLPVRGERTRLAIIGIFQIALCLGISTIGLGYVGAGRAAVLMYTMQLWVLPLGWMLAGERITPIAMIGAFGIFSGLVLFMNPGLVNWHDSKVLFGNALLLISALCWALGACLYRRYQWRTPFWSQAFWQILWSGIVIAMAAPVLGPHRPVVWNGAVIGVLVYNWLGATALCYALWGKVLTMMPAWRAGQFLSLTPVVAVLISSALTGEALTASAIVSVCLVAGGICLAAWKK